MHKQLCVLLDSELGPGFSRKKSEHEAATIKFFSALLGLHIEEFPAVRLCIENIKQLFYTTLPSLVMGQ